MRLKRAASPLPLLRLRQAGRQRQASPQSHEMPAVAVHLDPAAGEERKGVAMPALLQQHEPQEHQAEGDLAVLATGGEEAGGVLEEGLGLVDPALLPTQQRQHPAVESAVHEAGQEGRGLGEQEVGGLHPGFQPPGVGAEAEGARQGRRRFLVAFPEEGRQPDRQASQLRQVGQVSRCSRSVELWASSCRESAISHASLWPSSF